MLAAARTNYNDTTQGIQGGAPLRGVTYTVSLDGGANWSDALQNGRVTGLGYYSDTSITLNGVTPGPLNVMVRAMNAVNDLGNPVNPGTPSRVVPFTLAA